MKSITLYLILSVLLSAKLSLIDGAPPKDFHQLLQPMIDHFEEFKQKVDRNDNLDGTITDLKKDIKLLKSELAVADVQIKVKKDIIRVQDEKISKLLKNNDESVNALNENIGDLKNQLKIAQDEIASKNILLSQQINESMDEKAQLNNQITDLSEQLQNLNSEWEIAKEVIKTKEEDINLKSNVILRQNELLINKEIRIGELNDQILLKDKEIESKNEAVERIRVFLDNINKIKLI